MDAIQVTLRRIRGWFIVWFVVESAAGLAIAVYVVEGLRHHSMIGWSMAGATPEVTLISGIAVLAVLLGLAWTAFQALLRFRPWARIVILVVAWLTTADAALSLLTMPASAALLGLGLGIAAEQWSLIQTATILTKSVDLLFCSWVIYTLQFTPAVRGAFEDASPRTDVGRE